MALVPGLPDPVDFRLGIETLPAAPRTDGTIALRLSAIHPRTGERVRRFDEIHEKLLHLFLLSEDRRFFAHEHPEPEGDGYFRLHVRLPLPGFYRLLADFYPAGATPQLVAAPLFVTGPPQPFEAPGTPNLQVRLRTEPERPLAGSKTMLFFDLSPADGLEPWLGAWGHLMVAGEGAVDLLHLHPAWEPYQNSVQFNVIFPQPGEYVLWGQFQRRGIVNTARFAVRAESLG